MANSKGKKRLATQQNSLQRSLKVSLAGAKAGGVLTLENLKRRFGVADHTESEVLSLEAKRFVEELGRLKGSYVKIGQLLAQFGEHLLPRELTDALHGLESSTEALGFELIEPVLKDSLGQNYAKLDIDPQAMAAASLAQVHVARLVPTTVKGSGVPHGAKPPEEICLKVLYPGLRESIDSDFNAVIRMLKLGSLLHMNRQMKAWLEHMRSQLKREADYRIEAGMTELTAALVADLCESSPSLQPNQIAVPAVVSEFSKGDVLALERIHGFAVNAPEILGLSQARRNALGRTMLELFFAEVFQWGVVQTDPNFGNYLIVPSLKLRGQGAYPDQLVLLDFGSVDRPSADFLHHLRTAVSSALTGDRAQLVSALYGLGCLEPGSSPRAEQSFAEFCVAILEPLWAHETLPAEYLNARGEYRWADSLLIKRAGKLGATASLDRHFALPSAEFTLIARKLIGVFTFISVVGAEFNGHDIAARYIDAWRQQ